MKGIIKHAGVAGLLLLFVGCAQVASAQSVQSPTDGFWIREGSPSEYCVVSSTANGASGKQTFVYCSSGNGLNFYTGYSIPQSLYLYRFQDMGGYVQPVISSVVETQSVTSCVWRARFGNTGGPFFNLVRTPVSGTCGGSFLSKPRD